MSEAAKSYTDAGRYRAVNPSGVSTRGGRGYAPRNRGIAELRRPCNFLPPPESIKGDGRSFRFPRISFIGPGLFGGLSALNGVAVTTQTGPAGAQNASVVSSYAAKRNETLTAISPNVPADTNATCWHAIAPDGRFVYTSNPPSGSNSGFSISLQGALTPIAGTSCTRCQPRARIWTPQSVRTAGSSTP
jgi:hypothetical protein